MTYGQKLATLIFVFAVAFGGMLLDNYLRGSYDMGSRAATLGLMGILCAFLLGGCLAILFPQEVYAAFVFFGVDPVIFAAR